MRRELARLPFEEKIRRVGQLIRLAAKLKTKRITDQREDAGDVARLEKSRKKPLAYRPLSDVLADLE